MYNFVTIHRFLFSALLQVIFSMTGEVVKFGVVMLVVMLGFVMAFFTLFLDDYSFGQTWLDLFNVTLRRLRRLRFV